MVLKIMAHWPLMSCRAFPDGGRRVKHFRWTQSWGLSASRGPSSPISLSLLHRNLPFSQSSLLARHLTQWGPGLWLEIIIVELNVEVAQWDCQHFQTHQTARLNCCDEATATIRICSYSWCYHLGAVILLGIHFSAKGIIPLRGAQVGSMML